MGDETEIGWTDHTFNTHWGCTKVSPACDSCYAESFAKRTGHDVWGKDAPRRFFGDKHWNDPRRWNETARIMGRPSLVFCASMADVFEPRDDLNDVRARLWTLIEETPHLIWQLLTKRPEWVNGMVPSSWASGHGGFPSNVWIGTTVEDQARAEIRIPRLLGIPAVVRFLSCEPLLGPLDLSSWLYLEWMDALRSPDAEPTWRTEDGEGGWGCEMFSTLAGKRPGLGWIIVGGESGPRFRALDIGYARDVVEQANASDVPCYFKQIGGRFPKSDGDELDGRRWKEFPLQARRLSEAES